MRYKYENNGEDEFYTVNYNPGQVALGWIKEYIQSMEPITLTVEALIDWNKWFSDRNQYLDDWHVKWMKNFGHHVDEEQYEISEDEELEENYEEWK